MIDIWEIKFMNYPGGVNPKSTITQRISNTQRYVNLKDIIAVGSPTRFQAESKRNLYSQIQGSLPEDANAYVIIAPPFLRFDSVIIVQYYRIKK